MVKGLSATLLLLSTVTVRADDYSWIPTSGTNSFQDSSNWSPNAVPGASDTTQFTTDGSYGISFSDDTTNINASIGADTDFNLNSHEWRLTDGLFFIGSATARFGGGSFISDHIDTLTIRSGQKLILDSGSSYFRHPISTSSGTLEVNGGNHILNMGLSPSTAPLDDVSFRMTGGTLSLTNADNGARFVVNGNAKVALEGGSISVRQVMDTYGWANSPSEINIYTNASLYFPYSGINFSRGGGGISTMNIIGGSVALSNATFNVANTASNPHLSATGVVSLADGLLHANHLYLAEKSNSVAIVNQSGGQLRVANTFRIGDAKDTLGIYTMSNGNALCHDVYVGANTPNAQGRIKIIDGTFQGDNIYVGCYGDGTSGEIRLTGGEFVTPNRLYIGYADGATGSVIQDGGSLTVSNSIIVGSQSGAFGKLVIDGSPLFVRDGISIASSTSSTGELVIAGGEYIQSSSLNIGTQAGSLGRINVDGGDLIVSNSIGIASATGSRGELYLNQGRILSYGSTMGIIAGNHSGATGELVVAGGTLIATNKYALFAAASKGSSGTIRINGGIVDVRSMRIGHMDDCYGLLHISGGHTYLTNSVDFNCVFANAINTVGCSPTGRLELTGGIFETRQINGGSGYATALFDGGTLKCAENSNNYMMSNFDEARLTDNGIVADSNGRTCTFAQVLGNEPGYAGSFTKNGAGKIILSRANTFTGLISVTEGELEVTSGIYLTGGMVVESGATLDLAAAALTDSTTAPWSISQIDGTLTLPSGAVLTNGTGAVLGGSGTLQGNILFATGSSWAESEEDDTGALEVTGNVVFESGTTIALTGYTEQELQSGIPLITTVSGTIQTDGRIPVTLDGASDDTWLTTVSPDGRTLTAKKLFPGTVIIVR